MKKKYLFLLPLMLVLTLSTVIAQEPASKPHQQNIPFGKKLPPPDLINDIDAFYSPLVSTANAALLPEANSVSANSTRNSPEYFRQLLLDRRKKQTPLFQEVAPNAGRRTKTTSKSDNAACNFQLVKDINALSESNPHNYTSHFYDIDNNYVSNDSLSFAILDNVIYFVADDGIHGNELWRSDGTAKGTFLLKDIQPEAVSSNPINLTALNGKLYFAASGYQLWVSDGTESGTQSLNPEVFDPGEFFSINNKTYFIAYGLGYKSAIWTTDGTITGTTQVIDIGAGPFGGEQVSQVTLVNGLVFFTFLDYETFGWQIWRSDLTDAGTYNVGATFPFVDFVTGELTNYLPAQLTSYKNKLYFSANDGTGRKLWVSDGTDAGTKLAPGNQTVIIDADYLETSFPIVNNILCVPGVDAAKGKALFKYDPADADGFVKIRDFTLVGDTCLIVPREMQVVNNTLYFKVSYSAGGGHDELWSSKGTKGSTQLVYKMLPGETLNNLYNANGSLYFVKDGRFLGSELWRAFETYFGIFPVLTSDIFSGKPGAHPDHLTAFKGGLIFSAVDEQKGNELFITNNFGFGATLVKDINTVTTSSSDAGLTNYSYLGISGMTTLRDDILFTAYERVHGRELYRSDGTGAGTKLLNDVIPGEAGFDVRQFFSKKDAVYFIAQSSNNAAIYKTDGLKNGLRKMTPDYRSIQTFVIADNGLIYYNVYNSIDLTYELWRTDGTGSGTFLLSSALYYNDYLSVIGNNALFVAGDDANGNELWMSDGSVAGTRLIKDINMGTASSNPGGMFLYKNEVYFSAEDGMSSNPSFWKSNGTESGTIKLKDIDPFWDRTVAATARYFCISNNILYFSAIDHADGNGTQFWRTDGTAVGTRVVKDINPTSRTAVTGPYFLTDVNGTLFFTADDGTHGRELWKSDGTTDGTVMVSDLTPGVNSSDMSILISFEGKIYFKNAVDGWYYLWTSDGTFNGTHAVEDPCIADVRIATMLANGNTLFIAGNTPELGYELYSGKAALQSGKLVIARGIIENAPVSFNAVLYPNPAVSNARLQITGDIKNDVSIVISDMNGKKLWQANSVVNSKARSVNLPVENFAAGTYFVTVTSGTELKTIKLVKQ